MKKVLSLVLALVLVFALGSDGCCRRLFSSSAKCMRKATPPRWPTPSLPAWSLKKTEGRIKIDVFLGGTLYGQESEAIEALQIGDLAFARVSASPVGSYVPTINAIQMPYLYKSAAHMWAVLNGEIGQKLLADIETGVNKDGVPSGLVGLCYYDAGSRSFYLTKEVHTVATWRA